MGFRNSTLGEEIDFYNGKGIKPGLEGEYPAYGANGIIGGSNEWKHENSIIIGRVGAYCGAVAYCRTRFWASDNTIVARPRDSKASVRFFYYLLRVLELNQYAGGAAQPLVTQTVLKNIPVFVPDIDDQRRIAAILSAYDNLIENNTRRITILEEMARRIYEEWFIHFRFPGHEKVRMVESELGLIPEGWYVGKLEDVLILQRGFDLPKNQRISGQYRVFAATGEHGTHAEAKVKGPGVVTGRSGSLGKVLYVPNDFWPLNTTLWVKDFRIGGPEYAFFLLTKMDLAQYNSGAAVPTLNRNDIHGQPALIPSEAITRKFQEIIKPIFKLQFALQSKNINLRATRDLLLPKLISGELDVSQLPEPEEIAA
jgi:type I restriction enzyme S subunit